MALVGAVGASEYIARSIVPNVTTSNQQNTNYLIDNSPTIPDGIGIFSAVFSIKSNDTAVGSFNTISGIGGGLGLWIVGNSSEQLSFVINGTHIPTSLPILTASWNNVFVSYDGANIYCYVVSSGLLSTEIKATTEIADTTTKKVCIGGSDETGVLGGSGSSYDFEGSISCLYFSTDYIDFSQEVNRNLFVNQLGYPRDLTPEIEAGNIPTPLLYLPFNDTSNLGKNLGTGNDLVTQGTVTPGADFTL